MMRLLIGDQQSCGQNVLVSAGEYQQVDQFGKFSYIYFIVIQPLNPGKDADVIS